MAHGTANESLLAAYQQHRSNLLALARRYVHTHWAAEDVVHDVLIKCLERRLSTPLKQPAGYLSRMVRNQAIDYARTRAREMRLICDGVDCAELDCPIRGPEPLAEAHEHLQCILCALEKMPARKREAFERHRLEGDSQKSIAHAFGVSPTLINFMIKEVQRGCEQALCDDPT
ncbi:Sigma factor PvdS, controling pyoverdin biosynthesis [Marinobacterium lacunae]|uniref:Sigma factor PvdS, controling pyoverdin biosynthesis n=1 Tax=Marinobacterium lacunae TaxID=1232683 RepID=A0A081FVG3_9GAMM|nr:sigma-70 family RNA polymerase sigma factor [Marinobacterium lacunae]KEA62518.1 Sigma factor PvdS, controling pyoverdin biosynthesis [Marinobacterium lacunae]MBR9883471.1 sigma-70 family RNA polymerase sigma factor [Oceanospirillales bacterium]